MISASTPERTDLIIDKLKSSQCKSEMVAELYVNGEWIPLDDIDGQSGIDIKKSSKKYKYANFSLTPVCPEVSFRVWNDNFKYTYGSGTKYDSIIDLDSRVRIRGGYKLSALAAAVTQSVPLTGLFNSRYFYTRHNGSYVTLDAANTGAESDIYFTDLWATYYDTETYDDSTYTPAGYYVKTIDMFRNGYSALSSFTVSANTDKGTVLYRTFSNRIGADAGGGVSSDWTSAGATVNGTKTVTLAGETDRYLQIAVIFDGVAWSDDIRITAITVTYQSYVEWLFYDVFYLDSPEFPEPKVPEMPYVDCSGRDAYKRALETDINLSDLSGGVSIDELIKDICDTVGIQYTASSIADLSAFGDRTLAAGLEDTMKADEVFELCMQILNKSGSVKYQMYMKYDASVEDNVLFVQPKPAVYLSSFIFSYHDYESIGAVKKNYDKMLKTITVIDKENTLDKEVQLDSDTFTAAGTATLSWSGAAEYKRFTVTLNSGTLPTIAISDVTATSIVFAITGTTAFSVTITAYGNKWQSTAPTHEGEYINYENMVANRGSTAKLVNPLLISDAEAHDVAKGFVEDFGSPVLESKSLTYPYCNMLPEINDMCMLWPRSRFVDNLFFITGITLHWDEANGDNSTFNLDDSGLNFSDVYDFIWDETGLKWDIGLLWDMQGGEDEPDTHNIDFA